jgi:hypothetical protein
LTLTKLTVLMEDALLLVRNSSLYKEFLTEREEILRHKWIESEKAGFDIGFERAMMDWIVRYRSAWYKQRQLFRQNTFKAANEKLTPIAAGVIAVQNNC